MSAGSDLIASIAGRQNLADYQKKHWHGSFAEYLDIVFSVARPRSISTWGLSDRATWLPQYFKRADGKPLRPLPLDRDLNRKPMWSVLAKYV